MPQHLVTSKGRSTPRGSTAHDSSEVLPSTSLMGNLDMYLYLDGFVANVLIHVATVCRRRGIWWCNLMSLFLGHMLVTGSVRRKMRSALALSMLDSSPLSNSASVFHSTQPLWPLHHASGDGVPWHTMHLSHSVVHVGDAGMAHASPKWAYAEPEAASLCRPNRQIAVLCDITVNASRRCTWPLPSAILP